MWRLLSNWVAYSRSRFICHRHCSANPSIEWFQPPWIHLKNSHSSLTAGKSLNSKNGTNILLLCLRCLKQCNDVKHTFVILAHYTCTTQAKVDESWQVGLKNEILLHQDVTLVITLSTMCWNPNNGTLKFHFLLFFSSLFSISRVLCRPNNKTVFQPPSLLASSQSMGCWPRRRQQWECSDGKLGLIQ